MGFLGFELSGALQALKEKARHFVQEEIVPLEGEIDYEATELPHDDYTRLCHKAKKEKLWCLGAPVDYGGQGLSTFDVCVIQEELVQHRNGLYGFGYGVFGREVPGIAYEGTPYQIQKYVIPTVRGDLRGCRAITEPSGGSDRATAIRTKAVKDGDNWIINGLKSFVTGADVSDYAVVFVRTEDNPDAQGITCFFVDMNTRGIELRPQRVIRPLQTFEIIFRDVVVPDENRLGERGQAFGPANDSLVKARFPYSATNLGVAVAAQRMALQYAKRRSTFGHRLSERQAIQWMLVDSEIAIRATRLLIWDGALKADNSNNLRDYQSEAAICKLYSSEMLGRVVDAAVQIHGGYGVTKDLPLERWYREARIRRIGDGPSEIQRVTIADNLLRD